MHINCDKRHMLIFFSFIWMVTCHGRNGGKQKLMLAYYKYITWLSVLFVLKTFQ